jgi:phosphatidylserine/phosphatidylglycerophosphate/cardiolipin synthase-like enzyme
MSHSLIVLPDDTSKPILDALNAAQRSLRIRMFLFTEPTLLDAVVAAKQRGVDVRVMLNPARRSGEAENEVARKALGAANLQVIGCRPRRSVSELQPIYLDAIYP